MANSLKRAFNVEIIINPSVVRGDIIAPASKSSMQRAVAAALLAEGNSELLNPSLSDDSLAAMRVAEQLGAKVTIAENAIHIQGGFNPRSMSVDCGESGLGVRLFSAIAALGNSMITVTGQGSVLSRPMDDSVNYLRSAGAFAESNSGFLPLRVKGPLKGGTAFLDGSVSSQFLTGLLMALPLAESDSHLIVNNLTSRPYIDLTIDILSHFGIGIRNEGYQDFYIPGNQRYHPAKYTVEGDWSGAALIMVLGAVGGSVGLTNIQHGSTQPDRRIVSLLNQAGALISVADNSIMVESGQLRSFEADISDSPDLAPPLVALASYCSGKTVIRGTSGLRVKESDRGKVLESEFRKLGVEIHNHTDYIEVTGGGVINGADVSSHGDHRIAMALAVAATGATGRVTIAEAESVNKSYPAFFEDMARAGVKYEVKK